MLIVTCVAILGSFAIALIAANWFIAIKAVIAVRSRTAYNVSQIHWVPELAVFLAVMLWQTQFPLMPFGLFVRLVVVADIGSWLVHRSASQPP
jgi:hypothetical protein